MKNSCPITFPVLANSPSNPPAQSVTLFARDTGGLFVLNSAGEETEIFAKTCVIWAEESAGVSANSNEWSFGNGATGNIGIPLPEDWEAYAVSFNAENFNGTSVQLAVRNTATLTNLITFTANVGSYFETLTVPVAIPAGTELGFRTLTIVGTAPTDARVAVWLRQRIQV